MLGRLGPALDPDDLLQAPPKLRSLEARRAIRQVLRKVRGPDPIELSVEVVLDLG